jgi:hypothetical protein
MSDQIQIAERDSLKELQTRAGTNSIKSAFHQNSKHSFFTSITIGTIVTSLLAIYVFFGNKFLPEAYRWETLSGGVAGRIESASISESTKSKADQSAAIVVAETPPKVDQARKLSEVEIYKQQQINRLETEKVRDQTLAIAEREALIAEQKLYAECMAEANRRSFETAQQTKKNTAFKQGSLASEIAAFDQSQIRGEIGCQEEKEIRQLLQQTEHLNHAIITRDDEL